MSGDPLAAKNRRATRGLVCNYATSDLSHYVMGSYNADPQLLSLGTNTFNVLVTLVERKPKLITVTSQDQTFLTTIPESCQLKVLLDCLVKACAAENIQPIQDMFETELLPCDPNSILPAPEPLRVGLLQALQYRDTKVIHVERFNTRLSSLPCIPPKFTPDPTNINWRDIGIRDVPVSQIVGLGGTAVSWFIGDERGTNYLHKMALAIKHGLFLPTSGDTHLHSYRGEYWVGDNGRHRIAAIKGLVSEVPLTIRARITEWS